MADYGPFDFDPCPCPKPDDFDGLTCEWGQRNWVNPPFGSIMHQGKKKGPTAWMRKAIEEQAKGKLSVVVYPVDKWVLMMLKATGTVNVRSLLFACANQTGRGGRHGPGGDQQGIGRGRKCRRSQQRGQKMRDDGLETVAIDGEPPVDILTREMQREYGNASWLYTRYDEAHNARFAVWPGQTPDGRKHREAYGREIFPWEGSADTRVRTVDMAVNDEVRLIKSSLNRARIQAIPSIDTERMAFARKVGAMLQHTLRVDMHPFLRREVELGTNWRQMNGLAIMNVWWEQQTRLEMLELTRDGFHNMIAPEMEAMNAQADPTSRVAGWTTLDTADLLRDRLKEPVAVAWLRELCPLLDNRGAVRVLNDLRTVGSSQVPMIATA